MRIMWLNPVPSAETLAWSVLTVLTLGVHRALSRHFPGAPCLSRFFFIPSITACSFPSLLLYIPQVISGPQGRRAEEDDKFIVSMSFISPTATHVLLSLTGRPLRWGFIWYHRIKLLPFSASELHLSWEPSLCQRVHWKEALRRIQVWLHTLSKLHACPPVTSCLQPRVGAQNRPPLQRPWEGPGDGASGMAYLGTRHLKTKSTI